MAAKKTSRKTINRAVKDPAFNPNDTPQLLPKEKPGGGSGGVRLDPVLRLIPGNTATFVARESTKERVQAKIITDRRTWLGPVSNGNGDARVSLIIERPGDITVEFYEDGHKFASGTFSAG